MHNFECLTPQCCDLLTAVQLNAEVAKAYKQLLNSNKFKEKYLKSVLRITIIILIIVIISSWLLFCIRLSAEPQTGLLLAD